MSIFKEDEQNTRNLVSVALLKLLTKMEYQEISIVRLAEEAHIGRRTFYHYFESKDDVVIHISKELMNEFAKKLLENHASNAKEILRSYFEFWEDNIDVLLQLKKAKLLYFIQDNLPELIQDVALQVKHFTKEEMEKTPPEQMKLYMYMFQYRLAGIWRMTTIWCEEEPRRKPEEMSELMLKIATGM